MEESIIPYDTGFHLHTPSFRGTPPPIFEVSYMEIYLNWNLGAPANLATLLRTPLQLEKPV